MLIEIKCSEFISNGKPRPIIRFNTSLNTILGDDVGSNSIGKSTFLMIIDFVFGGDDYIDKSQDVQSQIGKHIIKFAFKFENQLLYFSRDTVEHDIVNKCDSNYNIISSMRIEEFRKVLYKGYSLNMPSLGFRGVISRFFRIYRRDNHQEKFPIHSFNAEPAKDAIISLMKLFGMYEKIEELHNALKKATDKNKALTQAISHDLVSKINSKQYKKNISALRDLKNSLTQIIPSNDTKRQIVLDDMLSKDAYYLLEKKRELTLLNHQKKRIESKLANIHSNTKSNQGFLKTDFSGLIKFFPSVDISKIKEIEIFHTKLKQILSNEFSVEEEKYIVLLNNIISHIGELELVVSSLDHTNSLSKKVLDEYHQIKSQIENLEKQNISYDEQKGIRESVKTIENQLNQRQDLLLGELQSIISVKMKELNNLVYNENTSAPILSFESGKKYVFFIPKDGGTGTAYKGLILFDLSILKITELPALVHDSILLKQIADEPLERILDLYQNSRKQVFIALDKGGSYTQKTKEILQQSAVIHLGKNGNELFGRSWSETN